MNENSDREREEETYHSARLHAQHQRIRTQVARVGQRVLLPQLGQDVPRASYVVVVQHKVALEEDVDAPRWRMSVMELVGLFIIYIKACLFVYLFL